MQQTSNLLSGLLIVAAIVLQCGLHVQGQAGFASGTDVMCYGTDSTCTTSTGTITVTHTENPYAFTGDSANPCCFDSNLNPTLTNYYTVAGSACQSCGAQNVRLASQGDNIMCHNVAMCTDTGFDEGSPEFLNNCCGAQGLFSYYVIDGGDCSPCTIPASDPIGMADPHFVCPLKNKERLCFSIQGIPEFIFNLFSDVHLQLNAKFSLPQDEESRSIQNSSTFIQQLGFIVKNPISNIATKVKISALDHTIFAADSLIIVDEYPVTVKIINNTVTTTVETVSANPDHDETAWVKVITDVGFSLKLKFVKRHLDYVITDSSGLSSKAHGIQGQFMGIKVDIDKEAGLMKFGDNRAPFSVKNDVIWPYLRMPGTCWYPTDTDDQGVGVLEGVYTDYIVDDLFAFNFKYNQLK